MIQSYAPKMTHTQRNMDWRTKSVETIRQIIHANRATVPDKVADHILFAILLHRDTPRSYQLFVIPLSQSMEDGRSILWDYTDSIIQKRVVENIDVQLDYTNIVAEIEGFDPAAVSLLGVAEVRSARSLDHAVRKNTGREVIDRGYVANVHFADDETAYFIGHDDGKVGYLVSSAPLAMPHRTGVLKADVKVSDSIRRGIAVEDTGDDSFITLARLFAALTVEDGALPYL